MILCLDLTLFLNSTIKNKIVGVLVYRNYQVIFAFCFIPSYLHYESERSMVHFAPPISFLQEQNLCNSSVDLRAMKIKGLLCGLAKVFGEVVGEKRHQSCSEGKMKVWIPQVS